MSDVPTPYVIDIALWAAARIVGAEVSEVGDTTKKYNRSYQSTLIAHARAYAALALRAVYPDWHRVALCRAVGWGPLATAIYSFDARLRNGECPWWRDDYFMRVIEVIEQAEKQQEEKSA